MKSIDPGSATGWDLHFKHFQVVLMHLCLSMSFVCFTFEFHTYQAQGASSILIHHQTLQGFDSYSNFVHFWNLNINS